MSAARHTLQDVPSPSSKQVSKGYGASSTSGNDFVTKTGRPSEMSLLGNETSGLDMADGRGDMRHDQDGHTLQRTLSYGSSKSGTVVSRSNTLKKQKSLSRRTSLKRSGSKKSIAAGSIKTMGGAENEEYNSIFHTPIPTSGTPTEILANRFQGA